MRILMLAQFYSPIIGGEENYTRMLSTQLAARGHQVAVATVWHTGMSEFEVDEGVRIYRLRGTMGRVSGLFSEESRRHAPPFPDPELITGLHHVITQERPQIVHVHNWLGYQFLPLKAWSGAKLVVSLHDMSLVCAKKSYMYKDAPCSGPGLTKCIGCSADHYGVGKGLVTLVGSVGMAAWEREAVDMFLPVSQATAAANKLVGSDLPYQVMPNFLPDDIAVLREEAQPYLAQLPSEGYLLYVGGLRRIKGIEVLLQAYLQLRDVPPLVLVGYQATDTPTTYPDRVIVLKNWPHHAVMAAWQRSLLGIVPSICLETFGLVVLEAMVMGKPVIASRIGGLMDLVADGETGYLTPPGDATALAEAMQRLVLDPALRERMGQAAQQRAGEYRASAIIPRIERVYQQVMRSSVTSLREQIEPRVEQV